MLEISFQMDQRKETLINSYGETKECELLYITSIFLRSFYPLLKGCQTGELPDPYHIKKSHDKFLRWFSSFWGRINPLLSHLDEKNEFGEFIFTLAGQKVLALSTLGEVSLMEVRRPANLIGEFKKCFAVMQGEETLCYLYWN